MAIEQVIEQTADKLIKAVESYGPQASSLVLETGRVAAIQNLLSAMSGLLVGVAIVIVAARFAVNWFKKHGEITRERGDRYRADEEVKFVVGGVGMTVAAVIGGLIALVGFFNLIDAWNWVGVVHPEIYLTAKLLKL